MTLRDPQRPQSPRRASGAALAAVCALCLLATPAAAQSGSSQSGDAENGVAPSFLDAVPAPEGENPEGPGGSIVDDGSAPAAESGDGDAAASSEGRGNANTDTPKSARPLSPDDMAAIRRIEDYLNGLSTLRARFIQTSSDGTLAEGVVHLKRPGRVRFEYDPPVPIVIVSNGNTLLYFDRELGQTTYVPLWETPLWFLVKENIDIAESELTVLDVMHGDGTLRVKVTDRDQPQLGAITLDFSDNPVQMRRWRVRDAQGTVTQVSLINPRFGVDLDSDLFDYSALNLPEDGGPVGRGN